ncbi:MAG: S41 family peptidase, partial [Firmicutes bacterium]|nr:S41 family peptidase [Bacillota bacterium]
VTALLGALVGGGICYMIKGSEGGLPGTAIISEKDYEEYLHYLESYEKLDYLIGYVEENYYVEPDREQLFLGIYRGLFEALDDPYSSYLTYEEFMELIESNKGEFYGIGVTVTKDDDNYIYVVSPVDDTPAAKAGVRAGDRIIKVDDVSYTGEQLDEAVSKMRGKPNTTVKVTILRGEKTFDLTLKREKIVLETVKSKTLPGNFGYIRISSFEANTAEQFEKALRNMELAGVKGLVIDLRSNPGGLVDQAVSIADMLLPEGVVAYTENQNGDREYYKTKSGATELPLVVLTDMGSASSSEILVGALKDREAAVIVGTTTYGKGIIQEISASYGDGSGAKLTVLQYYSPNGNAIHGKGIEPHVQVDYKADLTDDDYDESGQLKFESDLQLQEALKQFK